MSLLTINENTSVSSTPPPPPSLALSSSSLIANKSNELFSKTSMNYSLLNSKLNRKGFSQDDYTEPDEQIDNYNEEEFINNENNGDVNSDDDNNNNNNDDDDYYDVNKSKRICSETSFNTNNYENNKKINYFNKKQQILMSKNNENMNKIASNNNNNNNDDDLIIKTKLNGSFAEKGFRKLLLSKNLNDIEQSSQTQTNKIITSTPNTVTYDNISNGESNDDIEYSEDETNNQNNEIYSNCTKVNSYKTKNFNLFNFF